MRNYKFDEEKIKKVHKAYILWLTCDFSDLDIDDELDDNTIWEYIRKRDDFQEYIMVYLVYISKNLWFNL